jgi:branched-chain amino acid transport system substrate-binding protein
VTFTGGGCSPRVVRVSSDGRRSQCSLSPTTGASRVVRRGAGDAAVGTFSGVRYLPSLSTGDNRAFADAYGARYDDRPDNHARVGFDSVRLVANGVRAAGSADPAAGSDLPAVELRSEVPGDEALPPAAELGCR